MILSIERKVKYIEYKIKPIRCNISYGHIMLNTPDPVRSPQLKSIESSQYYGGGPHGNTTCCNFFYIFDNNKFIMVYFIILTKKHDYNNFLDNDTLLWFILSMLLLPTLFTLFITICCYSKTSLLTMHQNVLILLNIITAPIYS